ncbi:MAG: hypothetical protein H7232_07340 [Aeromicrobium sp.]|nr:hypothetical protein [Burkholderiales bacterium]
MTSPDQINRLPKHPPSAPATMLDLVAQGGIKLSPTQRAFKRLVDEIAQRETQLSETANLIEKYRVLLAKKLDPLADERAHICLAMLQFLDKQLTKKGWSAKQQQAMRDIICRTAETLLDSKYAAQMRALFDRHSEISLAELEGEVDGALAADLADLFGIEPDLDNPELTAEDVIEKAFRQRELEHQARLDAMAAREEHKRGRKKSVRQQAIEQQAIDAKALLKAIYRKLTSALHPDREPDAVERARKTSLMTEANKAYDAENLLELLKLQQQLGLVDANAASTLADDALKVINAQLNQQLATLKIEIYEVEMTGRNTLYLSRTAPLTAAFIERKIKSMAAAERADLKFMHDELLDLRSGELSLKTWLKEQSEMMEEADARLEVGFIVDFPIGEAAPGKRRR